MISLRTTSTQSDTIAHLRAIVTARISGAGAVAGEIDGLRLALAERIEAGSDEPGTLRDLEAVVALLTAAADRAEEAGL